MLKIIQNKITLQVVNKFVDLTEIYWIKINKLKYKILLDLILSSSHKQEPQALSGHRFGRVTCQNTWRIPLFPFNSTHVYFRENEPSQLLANPLFSHVNPKFGLLFRPRPPPISGPNDPPGTTAFNPHPDSDNITYPKSKILYTPTHKH